MAVYPLLRSMNLKEVVQYIDIKQYAMSTQIKWVFQASRVLELLLERGLNPLIQVPHADSDTESKQGLSFSRLLLFILSFVAFNN